MSLIECPLRIPNTYLEQLRIVPCWIILRMFLLLSEQFGSILTSHFSTSNHTILIDVFFEIFFFHSSTALLGLSSSCVRFLDRNQTHHTRYDSSGWVIGLSQSPLSENTQHIHATDILPPAGFEPAIPSSERPQTHALDLSATGIGRSLRSSKTFSEQLRILSFW